MPQFYSYHYKKKKIDNKSSKLKGFAVNLNFTYKIEIYVRKFTYKYICYILNNIQKYFRKNYFYFKI